MKTFKEFKEEYQIDERYNDVDESVKSTFGALALSGALLAGGGLHNNSDTVSHNNVKHYQTTSQTAPADAVTKVINGKTHKFWTPKNSLGDPTGRATKPLYTTEDSIYEMLRFGTLIGEPKVTHQSLTGHDEITSHHVGGYKIKSTNTPHGETMQQIYHSNFPNREIEESPEHKAMLKDHINATKKPLADLRKKYLTSLSVKDREQQKNGPTPTFY